MLDAVTVGKPSGLLAVLDYTKAIRLFRDIDIRIRF